MTESKSSEAGDRLSELPDSLIFHILSFLHNTRDVVRTTILSHRWKNLWTTIPYLTFDYLTFDDYRTDNSADKVRNFINESLKLWRGVRILKFRVCLHPKIEKSIISDIDSWVRFATENEVEELDLGLIYAQTEEVTYWAPQYLYSCSSLKVLSILRCSIDIQQNLEWNQLKSLTIRNDWMSENVVSQILSGCPQLEVFDLFFAGNGDNLSILSSSLKWLSIERWLCDYSEKSMDSELRIWTPNLETLELSGIPYSKCSLLNVSSLTRATIGFYCDYLFSWTDVHRYLTVRQIFPAIQHVKNVTLSDCYIKILGTIEKKHLVSPLPNVKFLTLNGILSKVEEIAGLLEIFPELKMLFIEDDNYRCKYHHREPLMFERNLPKSFLLQLRTVEVTWCWDEDHNSVFPFIQFLLKYASKLEKMVFRLKGMMPSEQPPKSWFLGAEKVLRMPKSSRTVDIIFHEY